jgi:WD40 repeat protein
LWNVATGKSVATYNPDVRGSAASLAFSRDGKVLYVGGFHDPQGATGSLRVLAVPSLTEKAAWPTNTFPPYQVAVSPDGMTVAAALKDPAINFYAASTGQVVRSQPIEEADYEAVVFSPDGKTLALGNSLGFWLYNMVTPGYVGVRAETTSKYEVQALVFTPDGKTIVTGDGQGFIKFIDTATRKELRAFQVPWPGGTTVDAVVLSPDGKTVYCTGMLPSADPAKASQRLNGVLVLDVATAKPIGLLKVGDYFSEHVQALAITADGKRLAASSIGSSTIWLLDTSAVIPQSKLR